MGLYYFRYLLTIGINLESRFSPLEHLVACNESRVVKTCGPGSSKSIDKNQNRNILCFFPSAFILENRLLHTYLMIQFYRCRSRTLVHNRLCPRRTPRGLCYVFCGKTGTKSLPSILTTDRSSVTSFNAHFFSGNAHYTYNIFNDRRFITGSVFRAMNYP